MRQIALKRQRIYLDSTLNYGVVNPFDTYSAIDNVQIHGSIVSNKTQA